jgi:hypothetical protein
MSHRGHPTPGAPVTIPSTPSPHLWQLPISQPVSRASSRATSIEPGAFNKHPNGKGSGIKSPPLEEEDFSDFGSDFEDMDGRRPGLHRPTDGRSHQPLLRQDEDDMERGRPSYSSPDSPSERPTLFTRRSTMRSRSPDTQAKLATRKKYTYAAFFLGLSLVSFVIQTETAVYIQSELGWNKAYCMLLVEFLLRVVQF